MREIKFRQPVFVWGEFKGWHYWGFFDNAFVGAIFDKNKVNAGDSQEYTGLKDKNDKEIYEGDILKHSSRKRDYFMPVVFEDGQFKHEGTGLPFTEHFVYGEVIGNIYENPKLLEGN